MEMRMDKAKEYLPHYTLGEEIFNSVSHGVGVALACVGFGILIVLSALYGDAWAVSSSIVYSFSLFALYLASTLYHACPNRRVKGVLQVLDHCSIFLLIAGTYTPYTLITLRGAFGWTLFAVVWGAAIVGVVLNAIDVQKYSRVSMVCYVAMGWVVVLAIRPLMASLAWNGLVLLALGGVFYTVGIVFYVIHRSYMHSIWHLFVLAGSVCHYLSILLYVIPTTF
ncbi:hemolysin III family protein [Intestinimonas sp. MSJ-38]|uniref:PAQR family membrane homeostasis protein TrhA n=1 Tax=Intestinimonas sp. MSJ-38 TaxID=2841532 RepID=UPI00209F6F39|nr:hemolysin III family protein [Intestinimonas sp. MSJ-38]